MYASSRAGLAGAVVLAVCTSLFGQVRLAELTTRKRMGADEGSHTHVSVGFSLPPPKPSERSVSVDLFIPVMGRFDLVEDGPDIGPVPPSPE